MYTDDLELLDSATPRPRGWQSEAGGADRLATDQGGHGVGNRFNPPNREFNLFAQNANFNMGAYRVLEDTWAAALRNGDRVSVKWEFTYPGNSERPDSLTVTYLINGQRFERPFNNKPGGK
jgi:hypothetical protein